MFPCSAEHHKIEFNRDGNSKELGVNRLRRLQRPFDHHLHLSYTRKHQRICSDHTLQNVHAREFKLRLGFSSYDEQVTRNWHRQ